MINKSYFYFMHIIDNNNSRAFLNEIPNNGSCVKKNVRKNGVYVVSDKRYSIKVFVYTFIFYLFILFIYTIFKEVYTFS